MAKSRCAPRGVSLWKRSRAARPPREANPEAGSSSDSRYDVQVAEPPVEEVAENQPPPNDLEQTILRARGEVLGEAHPMRLVAEIHPERTALARIANDTEIELLLGDARTDSLVETIMDYSRTLVNRLPIHARQPDGQRGAPPPPVVVSAQPRRPPPPSHAKAAPPAGPSPRIPQSVGKQGRPFTHNNLPLLT